MTNQHTVQISFKTVAPMTKAYWEMLLRDISAQLEDGDIADTVKVFDVEISK